MTLEPTPAEFSHLDPAGRARMVDLSTKPDSARVAVAEGRLACAPRTIELLRTQALPKGDVLTVAQIAGIQAAKATSALIPLCHPLALTGVAAGFMVEAHATLLPPTLPTTAT